MSTSNETRPDKPRVVDIAVKLLYLTLIIWLVLVGFQWPTLMAQGAVMIAVFILAFSFGILGWFTYMVGLGRNWARITMLVFEVIGLPFCVWPIWVRLRESPLIGTIEVAQTLLRIVALVLLFTPAARQWFRRLADPPLPSEVH